MTKTPYFLLDVFTDQRYGGNQLAIFPNGQMIPEDQLQKIAKELNLSETVFLFPKTSEGKYPMRIFTPNVEMPTAGHPSIGTAFYLAREIANRPNHSSKIVLSQKVGDIELSISYRNNLPGKVTMHAPLPTFGRIFENERAQVTKLLSLKEEDLLSHCLQAVSCGVPYLIVPLKTMEAVKNIRFRLDVWDELKEDFENIAIYAFTFGGEKTGSDLHGRMFAPELGVLEDPATGSAQGPLVSYLAHHNIQRGPLTSEQGFEMGRPSIIYAEAHKNQEGDITNVEVSGNSVFIGTGSFYLD